jgi:two-component system sensor histidine kinase UhpB
MNATLENTKLIPSVRRRLLRVPIVWRLLIGNAVLIVAAAIALVVSTSYLAHLSPEAEVLLVALACVLAIVLSLLLNLVIVRTALRPLHDLRAVVERVQGGRETAPRVHLPDEGDPDIHRVVTAVNAMLDRLESRARDLHTMAERTVRLQEDERDHIARGLHDETLQALSELTLALEQLQMGIPPGEAELSQRAYAAHALAQRTMEDVHTLIYGLRPALLEDVGLTPALRWYAQTRLQPAGIEVQFDGLDSVVRLAPELETALFRIVEEAVENIVQHAVARQVKLGLYREHDAILLQIEDDGRGFDAMRLYAEDGHERRQGLAAIQGRLDLAGGTLRIDSAPGEGTRLQARVPLGACAGAAQHSV